MIFVRVPFNFLILDFMLFNKQAISVRVHGVLCHPPPVDPGVLNGPIIVVILFVSTINALLKLTSTPLHGFADGSSSHYPFFHPTTVQATANDDQLPN